MGISDKRNIFNIYKTVQSDGYFSFLNVENIRNQTDTFANTEHLKYTMYTVGVNSWE